MTTVLFGDLVGFTPLSESRDAEDVRELLSRYFDVARTVIDRYGGTIEKFIGDAVMAVWGVPLTHEDDAERAVRAGLDLVDAVTALGDEIGTAGLAMRIGIVTGEVAVTLGATGEGMVAGDPVNTAARIQTTASPGEVWVDEATRGLTSAAVSFRTGGTHALKGKSEAVPLFVAEHVVAAVGGAQRVDGLEAPFVGRDREMRLVKELFHSVLEEGRPQLVAVTGDAGVGKSRLGWEFFKYIDGITNLVRWHRGRCLAYGDGVAFWALAEMVRSRLDVVEGDETAVVVGKLQIGLDRWVADPDERTWLAPRIATLLGVADTVAPGATFAREDLFASWQLFFERLIDGASGVALLIEDMQWADDGLLDFLDHLLSRSRAPVFVLGLARPDLTERRPGWAVGRRVTSLYLEPLGDAAMAAVVDGLVAGLPAEGRAALVARAEGIPLYAVETVRSLIDRDVVVPRDGRYVVSPGASGALDFGEASAPTSLHTLLAARLDALSIDERHVVQNAAVLGLSFARGALSALTTATGGPFDLDSVIASLVRKEIFARETDPRSPERGQYRFVQAMVRSVAYETLSRRDRKARHLEAVSYLADQPDADSFVAVLATHLIDARAAVPDDPDGDELAARSVELLERAGDRAHSVGAPKQALQHFTFALSLVSDDVTVGRLASKAAGSALVAGRAAEGLAFGEQAAAAFEVADLPIERAIALGHVAHALILGGTGADAADRLIPVFESLTGIPGAATAQTLLARLIARSISAARGDARGSLEWWERAIDLAEAEENWSELVWTFGGYASALSRVGRTTMALGILRSGLDVARANGLPTDLVLNNLASTVAGRDVTAAKAYAEEGLASARRLGNLATGSYLTNTAILVYWLCGDWDAATELFEETAETNALYEMGLIYVLVIATERGLPAPAVLRPDEGARTAPQVRAPAEGIRAIELARAGRREEALEVADQALKLYFDFGGYDDDFPVFWTTTLDLAMAVGDIARAGRLVQFVADAPRGSVSPLLRALLPYFRARLAAAQGAADTTIDADFTAAEAGLRAFGACYWLARCLLERAEWLTAAGRGDEARAAATEAATVFTTLEAAPWATRAEQVSIPAVH